MTNEFDPLKELSDISEDEMNEFIAQQKVVTKKHRRQKPRESFVCFISFYESIKVGSINSIFYFLHKAAEPFNCLEQDNLA